MDKKILATFTNCNANSCLHNRNEDNIFIIDTLSKCELVNYSEGCNFHFHVINNTKKEIFFLAIDKCIYDTVEHKKCDFAVFDKKTFCFVEIKDTCNRSTEHKKKSLAQLETTITKFKAAIDFSEYELEAIISWKHRPLRPAVSTLMQSAKSNFMFNLNTKLMEGNQKEFH